MLEISNFDTLPPEYKQLIKRKLCTSCHIFKYCQVAMLVQKLLLEDYHFTVVGKL